MSDVAARLTRPEAIDLARRMGKHPLMVRALATAKEQPTGKDLVTVKGLAMANLPPMATEPRGQAATHQVPIMEPAAGSETTATDLVGGIHILAAERIHFLRRAVRCLRLGVRVRIGTLQARPIRAAGGTRRRVSEREQVRVSAAPEALAEAGKPSPIADFATLAGLFE